VVSAPSLTVEERAYLALEARGELARRYLSDYATLVSPDTYEQPPHVKRLIELLEAIERGECKRAIVTMPPRSSKSTHVSRIFPSWFLGRHPERRVILASYGQELATGHGRAVRDFFGHPRYPFEGNLRADVKAAGAWQTKQGGGLMTAGVGTGLTGFGGDVLIADDLIKGREEAESEIVLDHTWDWHEEVFMTRLQKGGAVLETGTRWSENDPIGRILNSKDQSSWYHLNIPYEAEGGDAIGRPVGERLPIFGEVPANLSAYAYSALYQQRPTPSGGGVFKSEWMQRRYKPEDIERLKGARWRVIQTVDLGGKQGVGHDPSAIATWGTDGISFYLLDYWSSQAEYADIKPKFAAKFVEFKPRMMFIEDATWAQPLISDLRRASGIQVSAIPAVGSKWVRADSVSPLFESGRVVLPERAPWLDGWMHEHLAFPNGVHDEAVDTTSMALRELASIGQGMPRMTSTGRPISAVMK
jgi:predicted phage terminase large subunit-like protein